MSNNATAKLNGFLAKDPIIKMKEDGSEFAIVNISTTDSFKRNKDAEWENKDTVFHNGIFAFGSKAVETLKNLKKGDRVNVTANINYKQVEDKDGYKVSEIQLNILKIEELTNCKAEDTDNETCECS